LDRNNSTRQFGRFSSSPVVKKFKNRLDRAPPELLYNHLPNSLLQSLFIRRLQPNPQRALYRNKRHPTGSTVRGRPPTCRSLDNQCRRHPNQHHPPKHHKRLGQQHRRQSYKHYCEGVNIQNPYLFIDKTNYLAIM